MKKIILLLSTFFLVSCVNEEQTNKVSVPKVQKKTTEKIIAPALEETSDSHKQIKKSASYDDLKSEFIVQYSEQQPMSWGENVDGVLTSIDTTENIVALTFDACDGSPNSFDRELISFLIEEDIPATLFIGGQWIEAYEEEFKELAENPLFEIANHGYLHQPLSVNGQSAYGIPGTANVGQVFDEVYRNQMQIESLTGELPQYFRSGTAYYDEVAVNIANNLGLKVVNYSALGDAGGTFSHEQIVQSLSEALPGSIYLFHMNQPSSEIANGVREGVRALKQRGFQFVQLNKYDSQLR